MIPRRWGLTRLLPALFALVLFAGCVEGPDDETIDPGYVMLDAGVRTFAGSASLDPNARGAAEYTIRRVRLYAFDGNKLDNMVYVDTPTSGNTGSISVRMQVRQTAAKTLYVIVNEPDDAAIQSRLALINNPAAFAELEYAMANYFTNSQKAFNSDATFGEDEFCLPMSGMLGPFNTVSTSDIIVPLPVTRSLARVDIMVQKNADVSRVVTIKSSTMLDIVGTRTEGFLFGDRLAPGRSGDLNDVVNAAAGPAAGLIVPTRNAGDNDAAVRAFSFYTPERDCTAEKLGFRFKGVDFEGRIGNFEVKIGDEDARRLTKIERNRIYRIWCSFTPISTDVETEVLDWEDAPVTGDIGGSILAVDRSRVLMDYAVQDYSFSTQVHFAADNKVSFVGYVLKNADGTDASVTTDGSNLPTWLPKANISGLPDGTAMMGTISLKYALTSDAHPDVALRIKTGNITKDITVVYDNGFIPESLLPAEWALNKPGVGLQFAKRGNVQPSGAANTNWDSDVSQWSPIDAVSIPAARQTGYGYGASNTTSVITTLGSSATAANKCRLLGEDWYFSSTDELLAISKLKNYFGFSYLFYIDEEFESDSFYWTSSEIDASACWYVSFLGGSTAGHLYGRKNGFLRVRCVRNI